MTWKTRLGTALLTAAVSLAADAEAQDQPGAAPGATPTPEGAPVTTEPSTPVAPTETAPPDVTADAVSADAVPVEEPAELTEAELAELGLSTTSSGSALDTSLKFWGFADFSVSARLMRRTSTWSGLLGRDPTFFVGNFNVYLSKNITERIRTLGEVRFTYLPNGVPDASTGAYASTQVATDYSTLGPMRWGGISIQRIYVEATLHEMAVLRIGHFLTPYGIWNVDHGSPVFVPVSRPVVLNQAFFPESQTGFELFGRKRVGAENVVGYHLTLSNGLGPISEYHDLDRNKAVGGRLYWQWEGFGQLQIGGSALYARDTSSVDAPGLSADGKLAWTEKISTQSDVLALAADVRWALGGFLLQSEFVSQQRKYTNRGRVGGNNPLLGQWVAPQDGTQLGAYVLAGHRFDWLGVMPYLLFSRINIRDFRSSSEVQASGLAGGLNVRPIDAFVVKVEYTWSKFNKNLISTQPLHGLQAQVAWAF